MQFTVYSLQFTAPHRRQLSETKSCYVADNARSSCMKIMLVVKPTTTASFPNSWKLVDNTCHVHTKEEANILDLELKINVLIAFCFCLLFTDLFI